MDFTITRGKRARAQRVVIYGPEGIGKSSFAAQFPEPLFIDTEGSTDNMDVARLNKPTSYTMLKNQIAWVKANPTACKTLVIDTIDWAEALAINHICAENNQPSIESFGYGNGYIYLWEEIGRLLNLLQELVELGINVVLTAHAQVKKFTKPDEMGGYDRYELKLSNRKTEANIAAKVKEWADMVLFLDYKTYIVTDDKTKKQKAQGGQRVIHATHSPAWDAKNRHGLPDELPLDYAGIAHIFVPAQPQAQSQPQAGTMGPNPVERADPAPQQPQTQQTVQDSPQSQEQTSLDLDMSVVADKAQPVPTTEQSQQVNDISPLIPKALQDLMISNQVTQEEVLQATYVNNIYPLGTPVENIDPDYWNYMASVWDKVMVVINEKVRANPDIPFTVEGA